MESNRTSTNPVGLASADGIELITMKEAAQRLSYPTTAALRIAHRRNPGLLETIRLGARSIRVVVRHQSQVQA